MVTPTRLSSSIPMGARQTRTVPFCIVQDGHSNKTVLYCTRWSLQQDCLLRYLWEQDRPVPYRSVLYKMVTPTRLFCIVQDGHSNKTVFFDTYGSKTDPSIYGARWAEDSFMFSCSFCLWNHRTNE